MTVAADSYEPVVVQSSATSVVIPIDFEYGAVISSLFINQQDLVTGLNRTSAEGGFTFAINEDGTEVTVEHYSVFLGDNTEYTVSRQIPVSQEYDIIENEALDSNALEQQLDDNVRMIQDIAASFLNNAITSTNPFVITDKVNRAGLILAFDASGDPTYIISQSADAAEAWAITPENTPVPVIYGGDGVTTFSALHWSAKAEGFAAGVPQVNYTATVAPAVGNDTTEGYAVGSRWINITADISYVALDVSTGAAIWKRTDNLQGNFSATVAPDADDDADEGYEVGSIWVDVTLNRSYICVDSTNTAAIWILLNSLLNNYAATVAPAVTDDSASGYAVGSQWIDVTADNVYACVDSSVGAAVWIQTNATSAVMNDYILLQNQQASGTGGGTFTSGSFNQVVLNTEVNDSGGHCTLSANRFTLAAGTYVIIAEISGNQVNDFKLKLVNDPAGTPTDEIIGGQGMATSGGSPVICDKAFLRGKFTIGSSTEFQIEARCDTTRSSDGFGRACTYGVTEIYSPVQLWKVG